MEKGDPLIQFDDATPVLRAPFAGTVTLLPFHPGENVFPQIVLLRIEDLRDRIIEINLEQQASLRVKPNLRAKMSFENLRSQLYEGTVESIYPSNGQFIVRVIPKALPFEILPGMTVDVAIELQKKKMRF